MGQSVKVHNYTLVPIDFLKKLTKVLHVPQTNPNLTVYFYWEDDPKVKTFAMCGQGIYDLERHSIVIKIPKFRPYPYNWVGKDPYRTFLVEDQCEYITRILAHEMRHAWQRDNTPYFSTYAYYEAELDAENYAEAALNMLRNGTLLTQRRK